MKTARVALPQVPPSCTVYTDHDLAAAMTSRIRGDMGERWLDPCVGTGAFPRALIGLGVKRQLITGVDISVMQSPGDGCARVVRGVDFLAWSELQSVEFDKIVANPPYCALSRLEGQLADAALRTLRPDGTRVPLSANYWCAFVSAALKLLRPGGGLSFVLPAAWEYAGYATPYRKLVPQLFERFELHRSREPLFATVQEGCVVIVGTGYQQQHVRSVRFEHESRSDLVASLLDNDPDGRGTAAPRAKKPRCVTALRNVLALRLGTVTGDSRFFLMTEAQRVERKIPTSAVVPVVTKSRHIRRAWITRHDWERLKADGERIWMFRPAGTRNAAVARYLEGGGCDRSAFKVARRGDSWYRPDLPVADAFISGMSTGGPWLSLNRMRGLSATNTLYVARFTKRLGLAERAAWGLAFLTTYARVELDAIKRAYPDGLVKYEPGDLAGVMIPVPHKTSDAVRLYEKAVATLFASGPAAASKIADSWFR